MAEQKEIQNKLSRVIANAPKFLDGFTDEHFNNPNYIPESLQPYLNAFLREGSKNIKYLMNELEKYDKSSDEYVAIQKEIEHIPRSFMNMREQVDKYKNGIASFKKALGEMNKGTQDSNYYLNSAIFGNQWDDMTIDEVGNMQFHLRHGGKKEDISTFKLNDISNVISGSTPIITEPWIGKKYVYDLAQKTKIDKDNGREFDYAWTYNNVLTTLTDNGPVHAVGMAFTDLVGDGQTKSFAEMWEHGLKDKDYYVHPDTGESLPLDTIWMKDINNSEVVSKLLSKYITSVMKDLYGVVDKKTGVVKKTQADLAQEVIEKYKNFDVHQESLHPGENINK